MERIIFFSIFKFDEIKRVYQDFIKFFLQIIFKKDFNQLAWFKIEELYYDLDLTKILNFIYINLKDLTRKEVNLSSLFFDYIKMVNIFMLTVLNDKKLKLDFFFRETFKQADKIFFVDLFSESFYKNFFNFPYDFLSLNDLKINSSNFNINLLPPNIFYLNNKYKYMFNEKEFLCFLDNSYEEKTIKNLI